MAGTMRCSLLVIIILLISTVSGVIEISFEKGVPRLNNSLYCDYYFACHTEGETLQWRVGNNVFNYSGQSTIGNVLVGSVSDCNYTATLLSLKPLSSSRSFTSALILTCQSNFNMPINCSDGSSLKTISIPEKELSLMAETTNNSIYLEHVLSENLVNADNSTCTNVFVCGVNSSSMDVQLGNGAFLLFTEFQSIGNERTKLQGTSVLHQAILINKELYSLVVAMFIVGSEVMNVTCGFSQNRISLSGMQCRPITTIPETTGTMESDSSTVGESSTMASENDNSLPLILGPSITFGVLLLVAVIVIIIIVFCFKYKEREEVRPKAGEEVGLETMENAEAETEEELERDRAELRKERDRAELRKERDRAELERIERERAELRKERERAKLRMERKHTELKLERMYAEPEIHLNEKKMEEEIPLKKNDCSEIKKPKKMISTNYDEFYKQVQYIFLTRNENAFNAATTILTAPDKDTTEHQLTSIDEGVFIGMIGSHHVCLVNETGNNFQEKLENVIIKYFPNAEYLVFVGKCYVISQNKLLKLKLADIVIAKCIYHAATDQEGTEIIAPEIRSKFCFYPNEVETFLVTENRAANYWVSMIASGKNIFKDENLRDFSFENGYNIYGCDEISGKLMSHFKKQIDMGNNTTKKMQVITIGAVTGYVDGETVEEHEEWQFIAFQAAFHYAASKMTNPHFSGDISYKLKDPVSVSDTSSWKEFGEQVHYLILLLYRDELHAATTNISGSDNCDNIIEIKDDIYMGMIGSHKVGVLFLGGNRQYDLNEAIKDHFPNAKYLVRVGACAGRYERKKLGDVLISKSITYLHKKEIKMTSEINRIFGKSDEVDGLLLPSNRKAEHFVVHIASGTSMDIQFDETRRFMKEPSKKFLGFEELGEDLVRVQDEMAKNGKKIHVIIITGVSCNGYSEKIINKPTELLNGLIMHIRQTIALLGYDSFFLVILCVTCCIFNCSTN